MSVSAIGNGPGGPYQSRWEHAQVTTASCRLTEARCWLEKDGVELTKRAGEARKLINISSDILRHMERINSTWRQNDLYNETAELAQTLMQHVAGLLGRAGNPPVGG